MKKDRWHQEIIIMLKPGTVMFSELAGLLLRLGYSTDESGEVFSYIRQDHIETWQTEDLVTVSVFHGEKELDYYDDENQEIDKIELGYLLPWQPIENAKLFVAKAWELARELETLVLLSHKEII